MTLRNLASVPLADVIRYWHEGRISDEVYEDYRQLWRLSAPRFSDECAADGARPITQAVYDELVILARKDGYNP